MHARNIRFRSLVQTKTSTQGPMYHAASFIAHRPAAWLRRPAARHAAPRSAHCAACSWGCPFWGCPRDTHHCTHSPKSMAPEESVSSTPSAASTSSAARCGAVSALWGCQAGGQVGTCVRLGVKPPAACLAGRAVCSSSMYSCLQPHLPIQCSTTCPRSRPPHASHPPTHPLHIHIHTQPPPHQSFLNSFTSSTPLSSVSNRANTVAISAAWSTKQGTQALRWAGRHHTPEAAAGQAAAAPAAAGARLGTNLRSGQLPRGTLDPTDTNKRHGQPCRCVHLQGPRGHPHVVS